MKRRVLSFIAIIGLSFFAGMVPGSDRLPGHPEVIRPAVGPRADRARLPLYFIANQGQAGAPARFYARTPHYTLWLTKEGLVFDSVKRFEDKKMAGSGVEKPMGPHSAPEIRWNRDVSRMLFVGAHPEPKLITHRLPVTSRPKR